MNGGTLNNVGGTNYPLNCSGLTLTKTDGPSWVACMGGDGYASTNAKSMVFAPSSPPPPPAYGTVDTTNRSTSLSDSHTGLADTKTGASSWANHGWGGDNFTLPGSHGVAVYSIELLSQ